MYVWVLGQVGRAGRFGTKGLALTFIADEADTKTLNTVQNRFAVKVSSYSKFCSLLLVIDYNGCFVVFS